MNTPTLALAIARLPGSFQPGHPTVLKIKPFEPGTNRVIIDLMTGTDPHQARRARGIFVINEALDEADRLIARNKAMKQRGADFLAKTATI